MSKQKTILLTGASGFLGSYLLGALIEKGYKTIILKRSTSNLWRILHLNGLYTAYDVDVDSIERAFEENKIDYVIHTACNYGRNGESIPDILIANLVFGIKLLDACLKFKAETFFNTDTMLQGDLNNYTLSKKQFVDWLKFNSKNINVVNLKLEYIYGPKDDTSKFVPWLINEFKNNVKEINLTKGEQVRDFIYIDDVVSAYLTIIEKRNNLNGFSEFDVCTGDLISLKEFVNKVKSILEYKIGKISTQLLFGALPYRNGEIMNLQTNNYDLLQMGWSPLFSLDTGIEKTIEDNS